MSKKFPIVFQHDLRDCGLACLSMIFEFYNKIVSLDTLKTTAKVSDDGLSLLDLTKIAKHYEFNCTAYKISTTDFSKYLETPFIAHWKGDHFVVVYKIGRFSVTIADPSKGIRKISKKEFIYNWQTDKNPSEGYILLIKPSQIVADQDHKEEQPNFSTVFKLLKPHYKLLRQVGLGLLFVTIIQSILPFITQSVVDIGIRNNDYSFIVIVLIGQFVLFISRSSIDILRSWIMLHVSIRINMSLLTDFFKKLFDLQFSFFDDRKLGDILQRLGDNERIQGFLTNSLPNIIFSTVSILVFGTILAIYSLKVFAVFIIGSAISSVWILLFLKRRKRLDNMRFDVRSENNSLVIDLLNGIPEIKLANIQVNKRWEWEKGQTNIYNVQLKNLVVDQLQFFGATVINESKNIAITLITAFAVIDGTMTLGMMLATMFIIGQLASPFQQIVTFIQLTQEANISFNRLKPILFSTEKVKKTLISDFEVEKEIKFNTVSFGYKNETVLSNINFSIPIGKNTVILGPSGMGKSTLFKLLLKMYHPNSGYIAIDGLDLREIDETIWYNKCSAVLQESYIFNDTIINNICLKGLDVDMNRIRFALTQANLYDFVLTLPDSFNTKIGREGHQLSKGQAKRLLIARIIYSNPDVLLFDEIMASLDRENERIITENILKYAKDKTCIFITHDPKAVKLAQHVIYLESGHKCFSGPHEQLLEESNSYRTLFI